MKLFKPTIDARKNIEKAEPVELSPEQLALVSGGFSGLKVAYVRQNPDGSKDTTQTAPANTK